VTAEFGMPGHDWLTRFLQMVPVTGRVEHRCLFGAPWRLDNSAARRGEIPYHIVLEGSAVLENPDGRVLCHLGPGDIAILADGAEHVLHDGSANVPNPIRSSKMAGFHLDENSGEGERLDMLCGSFLLSIVHERLIRAYFPRQFVVRTLAGAAEEGEVMRGSLLSLVALMRAETSYPSLGSEAVLDAFSTALFALSLRFGAASNTAPSGLLALAGNPRLAPALTVLMEEPGRAWTLPELADRCHMSRATFIRQFQAALGRSAADMLADIRMTVAANALRDTDASTGAVAELAGYQSEAAFQRAFKARLGQTPAQYRREVRLTERGEGR